MPGVPDFTAKYNTKLSPEDELKFKAWAAKSGKLGDLYDYDLRGAWKTGGQASANGHLPDTYKKPNHPTFSDESEYSGSDGYQGGKWQQTGDRWNYLPSTTNLQFRPAEQLQLYFQDREPDANLVLPAGK